MKMFTRICLSITLVCGFQLAFADADQAIADMQQRWAEANYQLQDKAQVAAFKALLADVDTYQSNYGDNAGVMIWGGIIKSTFAGVEGGLGALKFAKAAKKDLEAAIKLDDSALSGSAYTSLGTLFSKVPGWPIGFGDDDKAAEMLKKALTFNPDGIDSNYFYAEFLFEQDKAAEAKQFLLKAQNAAPREGRAIADEGRKAEISALLQKVDKALN